MAIIPWNKAHIYDTHYQIVVKMLFKQMIMKYVDWVDLFLVIRQ